MTKPSIVPGGIVVPTASSDPSLDGCEDDELPPPPAPSTLGQAGIALWDGVVADWYPRPDELRLLVDAAHQADLVDRLAAALAAAPLTVEGSSGQQVAHPLLAELRQARHLLAGLLARLGFTDDDTDGPSAGRMTASEAGRRAARARWDRR